MDLASFPQTVRELLTGDRLPPLGPGRPDEQVRRRLELLTVEALFAPQPIRDVDHARCCLAALWLHHDFLDESHKISQAIRTTSGSYWHGIMHRREPDYDNAAYWFRRVGRHPVFDELAVAAKQLAAQAGVGAEIPDSWDPFWFIDYCERHSLEESPNQQFARLVQRREWELLFEYCYRRAI